jgi:hypothetical protein
MLVVQAISLSFLPNLREFGFGFYDFRIICQAPKAYYQDLALSFFSSLEPTVPLLLKFHSLLIIHLSSQLLFYSLPEQDEPSLQLFYFHFL